jgi:LPXTG-motif cell wall-anchored protein
MEGRRLAEAAAPSLFPQHGRTRGMYNLPHTGIGSVLLAVVGLAMTAAGALARLLGRRR